MPTPAWTGSPRELLRVTAGFDLSSVDPDSTPGFIGGKRDAQQLLAANEPELGDLQERLFAASRFGGNHSILLVLQAMDTAGKGGIVRHALRGADPLGIKVHAFKAPTEEELRHDFLWRIRKGLPAAGNIGVFDRSHYEDVLIHRVRELAPPDVIEERYGLIEAFEAEVAASGTTIVKVMLQISAGEQKARLMERLERSDKRWKYHPSDVDERAMWPMYQEAYQVALERTSKPDAPWFVVPANRKYYARIAVQRLVIDAMRGLDLQWPVPGYDVRAEKARLAAS